MPHYRIYYFDHTGHIFRASELNCEDDDQAILEFNNLTGELRMELWCSTRRVKAHHAPGSLAHRQEDSRNRTGPEPL